MATQNNLNLDNFLSSVNDQDRLSVVIQNAVKMGFNLKRVNCDDVTKSYVIEGTLEELEFCSTCERILIDTSYCEGCDEDAENDFNQSGFY